MRLFISAILIYTVTTSFAQWNSTGGVGTGTISYNGGNVGIGTSSPFNEQGWHQVLDVSSNQATKILATSASQTYRMGLYAHNTWYGGGGFVGTESNHKLFFLTNYEPRMVLTTSGQLGLGVLEPSQKFDVAGRFKIRSDGASSAGVWFTDSNGNQKAFLGQTDPSSASAVGFFHGGDWRLLVNENGNVGIGTNSPFNEQGWHRVLDVSSNQSTKIMATSASQTLRTGLYSHSTWYGGGGFVGTESNHKLFFLTNYEPRMVLTTSGQLGLGTMEPSQQFDVVGRLKFRSNNYASAGVWFTGNDGIQNAFLGQTDPAGTSPIGFYHGGDWRLLVHASGNVGIGTTNPTQKLEVKGTVYSTEVKVDVAAGSGPDYVFEPTYQLPTLAGTEAYIKANKHLPEVPSAKEMETNGINLSEMNMLLLKKVEELTLHLIEMKKK